jgi:hypothetical protein
MAEKSAGRSRSSSRKDSGSDSSSDDKSSQRRSSDRPSRASRGKVSGGQVAQKARQELADVTGLEPEGVTSLERSDDGTWKVTVEMLELERVPPTDDVLGSYAVSLDENGDLIGYDRVERYTRSQTDRGQRADRAP